MLKAALVFIVSSIVSATPLVVWVSIGPARIQLEETTFAAVAKQLGEAPIVHAGDAGSSRAQACYVSAGPTPERYYLESGEMGGGDRIMLVDAVSAGSVTAAEEPILATRCRTLARGSAGLRTDRGIALGATRRELEQRLQMRGRDSAGITLYEKSEDHGRAANAHNVLSWLRVRYVRGRVTAFSTGIVSSR